MLIDLIDVHLVLLFLLLLLLPRRHVVPVFVVGILVFRLDKLPLETRGDILNADLVALVQRKDVSEGVGANVLADDPVGFRACPFPDILELMRVQSFNLGGLLLYCHACCYTVAVDGPVRAGLQAGDVMGELQALVNPVLDAGLQFLAQQLGQEIFLSATGKERQGIDVGGGQVGLGGGEGVVQGYQVVGQQLRRVLYRGPFG